MKWVVRILGTLVGLVVLLFVVQGIASESGEVVVLTTTDDAGEVQTTRLWVVDLDDQMWLRSGAPQAGWFQRLEANPVVRLERDGVEAGFVAVARIDRRDDVNQLMRQKYGWADQLIALMFGRDDAIAIRLDQAP